jgi:triphosphoribosyl-dephospho-CoA synthase
MLAPAACPERCEVSPAYLATWALREELETWPKPGLVSPVDCGSHDDMDASLFEMSIASLIEYFALIHDAGKRSASLFEMQALGKAAERRMLRATHGINTHRGAIFSLGLLLAAEGRRVMLRAAVGQSLGEVVRENWGSDLLRVEHTQRNSHGVQAVRRYNIAGARDQAAAGFPHVYEVGLPALHGARQAGWNLAKVQCLFAIMAELDDTNLAHRGGTAGLEFARTQARAFLDRGGVFQPDALSHAAKVHREFVARRLSPGGAGDLLAATILVDALEPAPPAED